MASKASRIKLSRSRELFLYQNMIYRKGKYDLIAQPSQIRNTLCVVSRDLTKGVRFGFTWLPHQHTQYILKKVYFKGLPTLIASFAQSL